MKSRSEMTDEEILDAEYAGTLPVERTCVGCDRDLTGLPTNQYDEAHGDIFCLACVNGTNGVPL